MLRTGLVLAGLVGGLAMTAGPAVASVQTAVPVVMGGSDDGLRWYLGEDAEFDGGDLNTYGEHQSLIYLPILNGLLSM
ncbi:hypothetical protein HII36_16780 [Nonomuraea sp. NN258]|uniref:hypothetical protein n=1 Tax=Nonomuraea antri TaxID=2730852 RepID=UPI0015683DFD|nr:hypothetical protein [Nonomuraea antri]NRQ33491.1 hypothetical protein [Nonomuraea antri]